MGPGAVRLPLRPPRPDASVSSGSRGQCSAYLIVSSLQRLRRVTEEEKIKKQVRPLTSQSRFLVNINAFLACSIYSCDAAFQFKCSPTFGEWMNEYGYLVIPDLRRCQPKQGRGILGGIF